MGSSSEELIFLFSFEFPPAFSAHKKRSRSRAFFCRPTFSIGRLLLGIHSEIQLECQVNQNTCRKGANGNR
jgi:hypothetical protein